MAAARPLVHAVPVGETARVPEGMGAAMKPRSAFDRHSILPSMEARPRMAADHSAAYARPPAAPRFAPRAMDDQAPEFLTRREVTEVLDRLDKTIGAVGQAVVSEKEGDRDVSAFIALGIVAGVVALVLSS